MGSVVEAAWLITIPIGMAMYPTYIAHACLHWCDRESPSPIGGPGQPISSWCDRVSPSPIGGPGQPISSSVVQMVMPSFHLKNTASVSASVSEERTGFMMAKWTGRNSQFFRQIAEKRIVEGAIWL
jgi:hypothetical protein